jgi:hypothetical protein
MYKRTVITESIHRETEHPIYSEGVTLVRLEDEAGGAFIILEQEGVQIRLDPDELEQIYESAKELLMQPAIINKKEK